MDKELQIAVFKYGLIAPLLTDQTLIRKKYFKQLAEAEYDFPFTGKRKLKPSTFKKWLHRYRKYGLEGLKPSFRKDKGLSRRILPALQQEIISLLKEYRFRTVKNLFDLLTDKGLLTQGQFTYATLNNFVKQHGLFNPDPALKPRKAFEVEHINQLWLVDFMYGPYVKDGKRKSRSYLCAIIDDYARLIVSAEFFLTQSNVAFQATLKKAIGAYGLTNKLYADNGKVFCDEQLSLISARLGFLVIHSQPHDSPSRGKIERFFRTVRDCFIPHLYFKDPQAAFSLQQLNDSFFGWLNDKYNRKIHSTIKTSPFDRFFADLEKVKIRKVSAVLLDQAFLHTVKRVVNNDSTIFFENRVYEVPGRLIGKKIELRFDPLNKNILFLFENDKQIQQIKPLDRHFNAKFPIKFSQPKNFQED